MAAEPRLTAVDVLADALVAGTQDPPTDSWTPVDLNTLPDQPPIRPTLGGTNLIYPGKRHVFSGAPESAKTLAAYCILITVARQGQTGILIDFEMGAYDARQRLRELGATPNEISRILYLEPDTPATPERIAQLVAHQPALCVIDAAAGAYTLHGLDDNKRGDVERLSQLYVGIFWRNRISTILIDHVVKSAEDRGRFVIGSERKLGGADVHLGFDTITAVSRGTSGRYKVTTHKDRGGYLRRGHLADLHLDSDPDTNLITWKFTEPQPDAGHRPTHLMEKTSRYLELQTESVTRNTITTNIKGNRDYVRLAIDALIREGFATETDGPRNAKLIASRRAYRENDPTTNPEETSPTIIISSLIPTDSERFPEPVTVSDSTDSPPLRGRTAGSTLTSTPEPVGWFHNNGNLIDSELSYLETIAPDPDNE